MVRPGAASPGLGLEWPGELSPGIEWREWGFAFPAKQGNAMDGAWLLLARIFGYGPGSKIGRSAQMNSDGAGSGKSGLSVELCSSDSKKRGKKLRDVTESEQTQSTKSSNNESFLRDTTQLLENFSYRTLHAKEVRVFGKPELISTLPYIAEKLS
jgi:hypothetical protein